MQVVALPEALSLEAGEHLRMGLGDIVSAECPHVLFDLARTEVVGSAVLAAMLMVRRRAGTCGGRVAIASPKPTVSRVLQITRIENVVPVYPNLDEGRAALLAE